MADGKPDGPRVNVYCHSSPSAYRPLPPPPDLIDFPNRGTSRGDILTGLRTIPFRRRLTIAYAVTPEEVRIVGIARAGQDLHELLRQD